MIKWLLYGLLVLLIVVASAAGEATAGTPASGPGQRLTPTTTARPTATPANARQATRQAGARRRARRATAAALATAASQLRAPTSLPGTATATPEPTLPPDAAPPPVLSLPLPPGETWQVIQGYNCGTHDGWGRLSLDLVNQAGRTRGAPVYASADGNFWYWGEESGTMIIGHGDGYFTMYTHMQSHVPFERGEAIARGAEVGRVGSAGADFTVPHLHFTFFYDGDPGLEGRVPLPLRFDDGYDLPDQGLCNNHGGTLLTARSRPLPEPRPIPGAGGLPGHYAERFARGVPSS